MNNELFKRRLERAFERRAKEKQQQSSVQHVQNVVGDDSGIVITTNINKSTSASIGADNVITSLDRDEQYRTTIIQKMINHIKSKKTK
jgi:hypothetical protein